MISSIAWVPKGVADPNPVRYEMSATERELVQLLQERGSLEDVEAALRKDLEAESSAEKATKTTLPKIEKHSLPAELRMDEYSDDDDDEEDEAAVGALLVGNQTSPAEELMSEGEEEEEKKGFPADDADSQPDEDSDDDLADVPDTREYVPVDVEGLEAMGLSQVGNLPGMDNLQVDDEDDDSEAENVRLTDDDAIVLVAKAEDDFASLEVHVYDQNTGNLYVHHDIPLPAFPLCLAHGRVSSTGTRGNFCAVGTFEPGIEIWNLDVLNALEPICALGGEDTSAADDRTKLQMLSAMSGERSGAAAKAIRHSQKQAGLRPGSHTDAVMALSWNPIHHNVIASGSADKTVKLWDVTQAAASTKCCASTFTHHRGKVQSVEWNPGEGSLLATGSYDRTVALLDARGNGDNVKSVKITADCEALAWDPFRPEYLTAASEDGTVTCWDVRKFETSKPVWSMTASEYGVSDISYNTHVPGLLVSCSVDKMVHLWDTQGGKNNERPRLCGSKDMCSGRLYSVSFYPSSPWLLGCGGSGNQLALWDLSTESALQKRFRGRAAGLIVDTPNGEELKQVEYEAILAEKDAPTADKGADRMHKKSKGKAKKKSHKRGR
jgi:periodic tryptophan protein 1